jgi:hypothetical protein
LQDTQRVRTYWSTTNHFQTYVWLLCCYSNTTAIRICIYQIRCTYLLTLWSTVLLEKLTGFAANQEIHRILWNNPKVHHKWPPSVPILSQLLLIFHVPNKMSLFLFLVHVASPRNTPPPPPLRTEWGSSLPPDSFVSRGIIPHVNIT